MLGETVTVLTRASTGTDPMGEPTYEWSALAVPNCLVRPLTGDELSDAQRPDGIRVSYRIAFPKSYEGPSLAHARIALTDRGWDASDVEGALRVSGAPDVSAPCPTDWNMLVEAGMVDG